MIAALRRWALGHIEQGRYSPVGIIFHWTMAFLILFQLGWGWYADMLMAGGDKLYAYIVHAAVGLAILALAGGRLLWRLFIPGPVNDADRLGWQTQAAYITHYIFYICFFGLPLSGWAMWSALGPPGPLTVGGVLPWPLLPLHDVSAKVQTIVLYWAEYVHHVLVLVLVALIPLHVGAALKHHFWNRHDVLQGMLPEIPDAEDPLGAPPHRPREPRSLPGPIAD